MPKVCQTAALGRFGRVSPGTKKLFFFKFDGQIQGGIIDRFLIRLSNTAMNIFHDMRALLINSIYTISRSVVQDHSGYGRSNEPMNPCPEWIPRFICSTMIRVISDH